MYTRRMRLIQCALQLTSIIEGIIVESLINDPEMLDEVYPGGEGGSHPVTHANISDEFDCLIMAATKKFRDNKHEIVDGFNDPGLMKPTILAELGQACKEVLQSKHDKLNSQQMIKMVKSLIDIEAEFNKAIKQAEASK